MSKKYGKIKEEKRLQESIVARDITKTIMDYGVSQYQITKIIYLLSLELENRDMSDDILAIVKEVLEDNTDVKSEESKIIVR
tara:strand:- start:124 stop:369 length:246 start_codon:yes stop_codon:yes gene_type:complete